MLVKINNLIIETQNVTYIIDRDVHMNNGKSFTLLEPEIQELLAAMFEEPRPMPAETVTVVEEPLVIKKKVVKKK
jgi:hypothetical protein